MIVANIVSNLGNQLFIYAVTKAIALDLGYEYRYRVVRPSFAKNDSCIDNYRQEYCKDFEKAFHIDTTEKVDEIPALVRYRWTWNRLTTTSYNKDVYNISDNTQLFGYFLCPKYFEHRRAEALEWFRFRDEYLEQCREKRQQIVDSTEATHLVSVHVRCGKFPRKDRLVIDSEYHKNAIRRIKNDFYGEKLCFILFSDVPKEAKRMLENEGADIIVHHGTMFEDLCLMSMCDSHIVANSTFSWWGAWLANESKGVVIRPSIWPTPNGGFAPLDIYPSNWIAVEATREKLTMRIIVNRIYDEWFKKVKITFKSALKYLLPIYIVNFLKTLRKTFSNFI